LGANVNPRAVLDKELIKRRGFYEFAKRAWHVVETINYVDNWHIEEVCNHCQAVTEGRVVDLLINIPPGMTKSTIVSVLWPAWSWTVRPELRYITSSFDLSLALRDAEKMFNLLKSQWWLDRWGTILKPSATYAMGDYENIHGGFRFSTSVGGKGTGRHGHVRLVDDPNKPTDAEGATKTVGARLMNANRWWRGTMASRRVDASDFASVVVMQRIHENDLSQQCIEDGYTHLNLPMHYDPDRRCATVVGGDRRTEKGELLNPKRFDADAVAKLEKDLGAQVAASQLEQAPTPAGGLLFKKDTFQRAPLSLYPFGDCYSVLSIDCAFKDKPSSDDVGHEIWGSLGTQFFCYYSTANKADLQGTIDIAKRILQDWFVNAVIVEDKANGPEVIKALRKDFPNIIALDPKTPKPARAQAANILYQSSSVFHIEGEWTDKKEAELLAFPRGAQDATVDTTAQALLFLEANSPAEFLRAMTALESELSGLEQKALEDTKFNRHYRINR
jgi:phage terminase large subunit-like protein